MPCALLADWAFRTFKWIGIPAQWYLCEVGLVFVAEVCEGMFGC